MKDSIKQKALENHIPILMDDTLEVIVKILKQNNPKSILEIGTAVGYSAICFSEFLTEGGKIDTIERDVQRAEEAIENIKQVGVEDKINVIIGDAVDILPTLNNKYDIVFIDAAKGKYPFFLEQAIRMINKNGIIIADNVLFRGMVASDELVKRRKITIVKRMRKYLELVSEDENLITSVIPMGDGIAVTKRR